MADLHLRLVLDLHYNTQGVDEDELRSRLENAVDHLMANGLITGESEAELDRVKMRVEKVEP